MSRGRMRVGLVVAMMAAALVGSAVPAAADKVGEQGCTPGYWKNHTDNWYEDKANTVRSYETDDLFGDVFKVDYDVTLIKALQGGGGKGLKGAKKILARAATAALLNAAHEGLGYPLRRNRATDAGPALIAAVQEAWASENRRTMLRLARFLDDLNNLGCPLN